MAGSKWNAVGLPHKGWVCIDVIDLRADGDSVDDTEYAICQMCGNEKIRFVHVMTHPEQDENIEVGCVCAEKMSEDYIGPRHRETKLRNRAARRTRWLQRTWRRSTRGNCFLNLQGINLVVYGTRANRWGYKIGGRFSVKTYATENEAKLALFDDFWAVTQDNTQLWACD